MTNYGTSANKVGLTICDLQNSSYDEYDALHDRWDVRKVRTASYKVELDLANVECTVYLRKSAESDEQAARVERALAEIAATLPTARQHPKPG